MDSSDKIIPPPGLEFAQTPTATSGEEIPSLISADIDTSIKTWTGVYPEDIDKFDFALQEEECRALLYGRDDWFVPIDNSPVSIEVPVGTQIDRSKIETQAAPYLLNIPPELHPPLLNWIDKLNPGLQEDSECALAEGLRNLLAQGTSRLRAVSSDTLTRSK